MKKLLLTLFVFFSTTNIWSSDAVMATYYYAGHNCGHITASGDRINNAKVRSGHHRWVALSRDMFKKGYKLGDKIHVDSKNSMIRGVWVVKDKMAARHRNRIDFLMTKNTGKRFGDPHKVTIKKIK